MTLCLFLFTLHYDIWMNIFIVNYFLYRVIAYYTNGFCVLLLKTKWGMHRITQQFWIHKIYKAVSCTTVQEIPSLDKHSSTCRVFWDNGVRGGPRGLLMTDRTCICSGVQSEVEEESVGRQIRQLGRPLASSAVRPSDHVARSLHVGRSPFPQHWISALHATRSISGQLTWWLETPTPPTLLH
jgi:hypothetical protein